MVVNTVTNVFYLILFISEFNVVCMSLTCSGCGPGFYCSTDDVCLPCEDGYYKPGFNTGSFCYPCKTDCPGNTLVEEREFISKKCSKVEDSVCSCKHGYYREPDIKFNALCLKWTECAVGSGVTIPGTDIKDVVCEPCEAGFTSDNKSSTEPCVKKEEGGGGLSGWAVAVIATFCTIIVIGLIVGALIWIFRNMKRNRLHLKNNIRFFSRRTGETHLLKSIDELRLSKLSEEMVTGDWEMFFRRLFDEEHNPSQRIENVRTEYETKPVKEKIYRCLKLWIRVQGNEATNARFVAALRDWRPGQQSEDIIRRYFPYNINSVITDV
ncbi:tumor necrosis factor receptor superfamily member 14-like isoform X1 [Mya arenaria]|uniref:tumor necrosis factor receptor superfamily member 14-like isoform X1 n=1 Tax=Mya arenaria TaxID=6604 RepID=UPI0022E10BD5|nr:tumor necrosis factor receptor superfamily member 14-like isoform X1 [Mya arenaria]